MPIFSTHTHRNNTKIVPAPSRLFYYFVVPILRFIHEAISASMTFITPPNSRSDIQQRHGETLTSYLGRFNDKLANIETTTDDVVMSFLIAGARIDTDFWKYIVK